MNDLIPGVLVSIRPQWWDKIKSGEKSIEMRKHRPKQFSDFLNDQGFMRCYVYVCGTGKVCGHFDSREIIVFQDAEVFAQKACLTVQELERYGRSRSGHFFGWTIDDFQEYAEPLSLIRFGLWNPPQSWCYVPGRKPREGRNT